MTLATPAATKGLAPSAKLLLLMVFFLSSCQEAVDSQQTPRIAVAPRPSAVDSLTKDLTDLYQRGPINGFSIAIVNENGAIYEQGFGFGNVAAKTKYSEQTIQNIASISKTLIGIALLKAQELGKLNLDDPVNLHLPFEVTNPHHPDATITIRHLATHTSTIVDTQFYGDKSYVLKDNVPLESRPSDLYVKLNPPDSLMPMVQMLKRVLLPEGRWYKSDGFLKAMPGTEFNYSNIGATLAAVVLEEATGETFDDFTAKHILEPLQMSSTGWAFEDVDLSRHTILYRSENVAIPFYRLITYPDGGLITSAGDLSKYLRELIRGHAGEGTLLSGKSYQELFTKQLEAKHFADAEHPVGTNEGIFMSFTPDGEIGHAGADPGVSTHMFFNPKTRIGRILLVNTDLDATGRELYDALLNTLREYESKLR
jgi:CubicO group peptidase (beta-lactamase class C family)